MNKAAASITRQLRIVFAVSIVILFTSSLASFLSNYKLIESSKWVNHTNEVMINAESLVSIVKDAETAQRGYIITDDPAFLQPYNGSYEKALRIFAQLQSLTADNPVQQANLEKAKELLERRYVQMDRVLQAARRAAASGRSQLFVDNHEEMIAGKDIMDQLRTVVENIKVEERRLLELRTSEQSAYISYTPPLVLAAAVISLLISILSYFRIKADLDERIRKQREDEQKYRETTARIGDLEDVTQLIAAGDFSARSKDVAKDELGRIATALNLMASSLEQNFAELERRNWLQTGTVNIGNAIRGQRFVKLLSERILSSLATYVNAVVGTLYIADKEANLRLKGTFAAQGAPDEILGGQTLLGEAVAAKEMILVRDLPENYLQIVSSTGHTNPVMIIILPLMHDQDVIGVIELGMLQEPSPLVLEFLRNNSEALAIGLNAANNYEQIQNLLEETQAQSEELQAQHSELENINTELEAQTEKLQASEEELKVQQEELQQANHELEERSSLLEERNQQIIEKNIEVQRKAEELALSTKYKSEFLANMSHELRTPLNSILLLSRLLSENNEQNLNKDQIEYAQVIQSSGNGLLSLIDEILDLSKIEAGKMELEYEQVPFEEIAHDIKGLFEPVARERKLSFHVNLAAGLPYALETDKLRLEQVLKNLISNALKFTTEGSVELTISEDSRYEKCVAFAVTDTGIGIPLDKQRLIFEAFQQADGSTRRKYGGTGLGLSISKELVKLLNGNLELKSDPGKGSVFTAIIPLARNVTPFETEKEALFADVPVEEEMQELLPVADHTPTDTVFISENIPESIPDDRNTVEAGDKTILIVEDDTYFAKALIDYTRSKGYKAVSAVRGDEALGLALQYKPVGILLDIQLPVKNGWQVMEELKANVKTRPIPVHIMSSHSVKKESLIKGAIDFVDKPVTPEQMEEIFTKLEHVLNRTSKRVLIVEENPMHSMALSYFLSTFDINSEVKNTVEDSVEALKNGVDCVILDMGVPDQKSYDTLEEIKKNPGLEHLPIIIFTGKSLSMAEEQRIKQYADSIVVKTAHSYQRILDEISLFLHLVEEHKPRPANGNYRKLGAMSDVLKGKTVLIVDDDVRNIFSLTKTLEKLEMHIITAIDGKEAVQKLAEHRYIDIVLLDMMMPEMDGYETAQAIRLHPEWKHLPVIAVTAKAMTGDREKCIRAGASDYITKPVDTDQLISLLRVWLYEKV